ncbi:MAG: hypothetical protein G01um101470_867, partial [Parcubacteria group bacterium Gr01-1014_70]
MKKNILQVLIIFLLIMVIFGDLYFAWMQSTKPVQIQLV